MLSHTNQCMDMWNHETHVMNALEKGFMLSLSLLEEVD